jgi:hypothetical protein
MQEEFDMPTFDISSLYKYVHMVSLEYVLTHPGGPVEFKGEVAQHIETVLQASLQVMIASQIENGKLAKEVYAQSAKSMRAASEKIEQLGARQAA